MLWSVKECPGEPKSTRECLGVPLKVPLSDEECQGMGVLRSSRE